MATISLYAEPINRMTGLFRQTQTAVFNFQEEFLAMQTKSLRISNDACDMQDVISSIQASTRIQEEKIATLTDFERECEDFIEDMERIDTAVADVITSRKDKFYEEYPYLKPEEEKKKLIEKLKDVLTKTADWCKAHWKELLATTLIVIGVIAAIVVIVGSKGLALAPVLTALLTAFGVAASTAATIATVTSIAIATIAVISLIGSATLNIIDTWKDMSENPTFQKWQTALNITSAVSNTIYSIGEILSLLCIKMGIVPKSGAGVGAGFMDDVVEGGLDTIIKNGKVSIDDIKTNPSAFSGKSAEEIADVLRKSGYDVTIKNSTRSRSGAQIIQINNPGGGKNISQVQVSPGGGRHGSNPYVKISTTDQGIIKIVDGIESTYKTDGKETATIIFSGGN